MTIFVKFLLPLLLYLAPFLLLALALLVPFGSKSIRVYKMLAVIHLVAFLPYLIALVMDSSEPVHMLFVPVLTSVITIVTGVIATLMFLLSGKRDAE